MSKSQLKQQHVRGIFLESFFKVKKLKNKMSKLEMDFLYSSITLMNMEVALRTDKYSDGTEYNIRKSEVEEVRLDNKTLKQKISSARQEIAIENNLLMRASIENEDFVETLLNEDENSAMIKYPEFKLLLDAIRMIEAINY